MALLHQLRSQVARALDDFVILSSDGGVVPDEPDKWTRQQWWQVFQEMFISEALLPVDHDDMLFCVYAIPRGGKRLVAIRREPDGGMPSDLEYGASLYNAMDWKATVLLNIAMHTRYELHLCAGMRASTDPQLAAHKRSTEAHTDSHAESEIPRNLERITTTVLPRLSRIPVDSRGNYIKEAQPDDTYPYLAFALDDFDDDSAQQLMLREENDEFAVVIHVRSPGDHALTPWCIQGSQSSGPSRGIHDAVACIQAHKWIPEGSALVAGTTAQATSADADRAHATRTNPSGATPDEAATLAGCTEGGAAVAAEAASCVAGTGAMGGAAGGGGQPAHCDPSAPSPEGVAPVAVPGGTVGALEVPGKVRLFCGFVDYKQIHSSVRKRQSNTIWPFMRRRTSESAASGYKGDSFFLRMNGPRGRGRAETVIRRHVEDSSLEPQTSATDGIHSFRVPVAEGCSDDEDDRSQNTNSACGSSHRNSSGSTDSVGGEGPAHAVFASAGDGKIGAGKAGIRGGGDSPSVNSPTAVDGGSVPVATPDSVSGKGGGGASEGSGSPIKGVWGALGSWSAQSPTKWGSDEGGPLSQMSRSMQLLTASSKHSGGVKQVKEAAKKVFGVLGIGDEDERPQHYDCRFICLLLSVEEIVSALLELQEI